MVALLDLPLDASTFILSMSSDFILGSVGLAGFGWIPFESCEAEDEQDRVDTC